MLNGLLLIVGAVRMRRTVPGVLPALLFIVSGLWLLLGAARLPAQTLRPDSLFDRLVGHWVLRGSIARQSTTHDVDFEWMLGREYVKMHEVSRERGPNGAPVYEAVVLFGNSLQPPLPQESRCLPLRESTGGALVRQLVDADERLQLGRLFPGFETG